MIDPRTDAERAQHEARERTKRATALLAKVDLQLRQELYDRLWSERRNPWAPSMQPVALREPFE